MEQTRLYVYCLARATEEVSLGEVGIEDSQVYTVAHNSLCAVVHDCPAQPYQSQYDEIAAAWILAHHRVIDIAWKRWGVVLPFTFNTIIKAEQGGAKENLIAWLATGYASLKGKLDALAGMVEYGVQVFWDPALIAGQVARASPEIRKLEETIGSRPRGIAYMYRQKLESLLKKEVEAKAAEEYRDLYGSLIHWAEAIHVEKTKGITGIKEGYQMLMNLSCLVSTTECHDLEAELDRISEREGFLVRLVGPLPPYSFC